VAIDSESQEICFIREHYEEFLQGKIALKPGDIVLQNGTVIGRHKGLPLYTIGQRKGLHTALNVPLFVKELDLAKNQLIVTTSADDLLRDRFEIEQVNWIANPPAENAELEVQIRYNSPAVPVADLQCLGKSLLVKLEKPVRAVTPGQSAVFYCQNELLGGGIIKNNNL